MNRNNEGRFTRKAYKDLRFTDDFMFRKVLRSNEKLCSELIELLLGVKVARIRYKDDDHAIAIDPDTKGVRLDVYLEDEANSVFDLEMQNLSIGCLPERSRYYQSMIDVEHLAAGEQYDQLPDSYIVFICMFDPYGKGLHKYEFRELCRQDPALELGDGTSKVFINALSKEADMSEDMRAFLDYLCGSDARSGLTRDIDYDIERAKTYRPWEVEYMQWSDIIRIEKQDSFNQGMEQGMEQGQAQARAEMSRITSYLLDQNRLDDLRRANEDDAFRAAILAEIEAAEQNGSK